MEATKLNDKRNVIWNIIGATANAFNSFLFTIIVTRINGLDSAGIFTYAFATACLLYIIGIYAGRTFQVTDISGKYSDRDYIYNRFFTCAIMMIIAVGFALVKGYDIYKSTILILLCGFKCIEAFSEVIYGIIQKNHQLYRVGISLVIKAVASVVLFLLVDLMTNNLILSSISIVVVNIVVLLWYDLKNARIHKIQKTKYSNQANIGLLKTGLFTFVFTFLGLYLVNASRYAIDDMLTNDYQTIFGIIIMPATFMVLLGQYIIQPALTRISGVIKTQDYAGFKKIVVLLMGIILSLGAVILLVAYFLEAPVLSLIYGVELNPYLVSMLLIIGGSILYSMTTILSGILISLRKTFGQAVIYGIMSVITTAVSYYLVKQFAVAGASLSYFITMLLLSVIFIGYMVYHMRICKKTWKKEQ